MFLFFNMLSYIFFRLLNRNFYLPLRYQNFCDVSFGEDHPYPSYRIFYINIFNGKEKIKTTVKGYHLTENDFLFKQKIAAQKVVKYQRFLIPVVQDKLLKILGQR